MRASGCVAHWCSLRHMVAAARWFSRAVRFHARFSAIEIAQAAMDMNKVPGKIKFARLRIDWRLVQ